jgi:transposase-like protein
VIAKKYTERQRLQITMAAVELMKQPEAINPRSVALRLGISKSTLQRWLHRARAGDFKCPYCNGRGSIHIP